MKTKFSFLNPGKLIDKELKLVLEYTTPAEDKKGFVPAYRFQMKNAKPNEIMGYVNLRIGENENIIYAGHIGYGVDEKFRGNHYACRSINLLRPFMQKHGMNYFFITCDPSNISSIKTCERAGGRLIETVDLPEHNDQYKRGGRKRHRYKFSV
jgi:tagatose 1,6-diphosphate aldolase